MSTTNAFNTQSQDATTGKQQQPGYLEQAYNLAANVANTATTTASNALSSVTGTTGATGTSVTNDPTTNYRNQQPHIGGVGDLGTKSDADVTRLPEERANPNPFTSGGTSESLENPNISNPAHIQERLNARDPPNPYPEGNAGVGHSSDRQFRNQQDHVGGVGDLGTRSDADVVRLPEERANPDPLASRPGDSTTGAATGFIAGRDRSATDTTDTSSSQSHGWKPEQKSWDTGNVTGTMHDPTQHGHSGGVTGSNVDTDHGLGMPHRDDTQRGNRDEGAVGQQPHFGAGAMDFHSGRDTGFKADTRDQGVNEKVQAPTGVDTTSGHRLHDHRDEAKERHAPAGVDTTSGPLRQDRREEAEQSDDDDTTSPSDKTGPRKRDKLHGKIMVAKGKLTKDQEAIAQGERLQTEGVTIRASDIIDERKM